MATLREYFTDFNKCLSVHKPWDFKDTNGKDHGSITARISQDFDANAKYWSFFVPAGGNVGLYINAIFNTPETKSCVLGREGDGVLVMSGFHDYSEMASSETLMFTNSGVGWNGFHLLSFFFTVVTNFREPLFDSPLAPVGWKGLHGALTSDPSPENKNSRWNTFHPTQFLTSRLLRKRYTEKTEAIHTEGSKCQPRRGGCPSGTRGTFAPTVADLIV